MRKFENEKKERKKTFQNGKVRNKKNEITRIHDIHTHFTSLHSVILYILYYFVCENNNKWQALSVLVYVLSYSLNECIRTKQNNTTQNTETVDSVNCEMEAYEYDTLKMNICKR